MQKLILIIAVFGMAFNLSACRVNQGFPREIEGKLKPINTQATNSEVINSQGGSTDHVK